MSTRLAVIVSHPIQHFAPWHREIARRAALDLRVFFCCDWGVESFVDPDFETEFKWDVPLTEGYSHEFLPIARRPEMLSFREVDNPGIGEALEAFDPHVVQVLGWAYRTNWRATAWARRKRRPLLLYTDSNVKVIGWDSLPKRLAKGAVIRHFYRRMDGALYVGDCNRAYHRHFGMPEDRLFPGVYPIDRGRLLKEVPDREAARAELRGRHGIPDDAFVLVSCGKYIPRKRHDDVIRAAAELAEEGRPVWALLVGEGPQRNELEGLIRALGTSNVVLTGFVNQAEIPRYFVAADALVVASSFDAHPLVVSEGSSFGLPVVASDAIGCVGPNDTARPDHNALVYPSCDAGALASAVRQLLDEPGLQESMQDWSVRISAWQDASVAAVALERATQALRESGPR